MYHATLVTCGHSQLPGVMNDIIFWVLLMIMVNFWLLSKKVNVKRAFLHGKLDKEIYMETLPNMKVIGKDGYIILCNCIYGLVQAARQYNERFQKS